MVRASVRAAVLALALLGPTGCAEISSEPVGEQGFMVFTTAGDLGPQQSLHVLSSADGRDFRRNTDNPVYVRGSRGVRDPSGIFHEGAWYVAHTVATAGAGGDDTGTTVEILRSTDPASRGTWTVVAEVDFSAAHAQTATSPNRTWAPEFFRDTDGTVYLTVSINEVRFYSVRSLNSTLTTWDAPVRVVTKPARVAIDASFIKIGEIYHAFIKAAGYIEHGEASSFAGPYTMVNTGNFMGFPAIPPGGVGYEGPSVVQVGPSRWRVYVDYAQITGGLHYSETTDPTLRTGWTPLEACTVEGRPQGIDALMKHATVSREPRG